MATATRIVFPAGTVEEGLVRVCTPAPDVSESAPSLTGVQFATATVCGVELVETQAPLVTTARKSVCVRRLPVLSVGLVSPPMLANAAVPVRFCHWIVAVQR